MSVNRPLILLDSGVREDHRFWSMSLPDLTKSFVDSDSNCDKVGHGSDMADILVARIDELNLNVKLGIAQIIDHRGVCEPFVLSQALKWASSFHRSIILIPLGMKAHDQALCEDIRQAIKRGSTIVAAVGNPFFGQQRPLFPASLPNVIGVGAGCWDLLYKNWTIQPDLIVSQASRYVGTSGAATMAAVDLLLTGGASLQATPK